MAYIMRNSFLLNFVLSLACSLTFLVPVKTSSAQMQDASSRSTNSYSKCEPTPADYLGPFYKADAPVRSRVGKGYQLTGLVISSTVT